MNILKINKYCFCFVVPLIMQFNKVYINLNYKIYIILKLKKKLF